MLRGKTMDPIEIAPGIYDVGVTDWNIRDFHGYSTDLGTTYNSFLVVDEKIALIDAVKKEFADQLIENISRIVDPRKIDVVVSNHTEPDHSAAWRGSAPGRRRQAALLLEDGAQNLLAFHPNEYHVGSGES
jgi:flavorubredoxin